VKHDNLSKKEMKKLKEKAPGGVVALRVDLQS
jgi:hypothetical protein